MLIVGDVLVSDELFERHFCCDLAQCDGQCCIEGDAGAPVAPEEIADLSEYYPVYRKYMTPEGLAAVEACGEPFVFQHDEFQTPLLAGQGACAFVFYDDGIAKCAIEKAFENHEIPFRKPISCYLYPIRVSRVGKYIALNYHHWGICESACRYGDELKLPVYVFLKQPLIQMFGEDWYQELCETVRLYQQEGIR
ncbi:MAG: DUF3109 family protein [Bacteroidales bacterium]|nr:DUF3109 family protein [Bacteroidales bacterium]